VVGEVVGGVVVAGGASVVEGLGKLVEVVGVASAGTVVDPADPDPAATCVDPPRPPQAERTTETDARTSRSERRQTMVGESGRWIAPPPPTPRDRHRIDPTLQPCG
jgi:hypothetical protein